MTTAIRIPDIGTTVDYVKLTQWLKIEGDSVKRGEPLCEVETDKAVTELESVAAGVLLRRLVAEGVEVERGAAIAYIGAVGESVPEPDAAAPQPEAGPGPVTQAPRKAGLGPTVPPLIRNLARQHGVDLDRIEGTGPDGRITRQDILEAKNRVSGAGGVPLTGNQTAVARRALESHRRIPPVSLTSRIDMTTVLRLRRGFEKKSGRRACFDAFFVKAAATVMVDFPHFRSRLVEESVIESPQPCVGVAIHVDKGLFIPGVPDALTSTVPEIDAVLRDRARKAAGSGLAPEDLRGATVTVTNLGMFPVLAFQAIVPPEQAAVLAVGTIEDTPVVREGQIVAVPLCCVTLTVDHRLINGHEAGQFLARLKEMIESD